MSDEPRFRFGPEAGQESPEGAVSGLLRMLDPASWDPGYWFRFQRRVMSAAAGELSRRRVLAELTVGDVVLSWARALVPTAVIAAAAAAFVLLQAGAGTAIRDVPAGVEELLSEGLEGTPVPVLLTSDGSPAENDRVNFASETF